MDEISKGIIISSFSALIERVINKIYKEFNPKTLTDEHKEKICEAIIAIKTATQETRNFITTNGYQPNRDLSTQWRECMLKVVQANINENLPEYLYHKADFWGNPQQWLDNPASLGLVIKLNELDGRCDMLLQKIVNDKK